MVQHAVTLKHTVLESELEALLVEAELIRTYQPEYNTLLKDDKSPLYIHITAEEFPRVLKMRKREHLRQREQLGTVLGPYPSSLKTQEVLKIARAIFKWCNKKNPTQDTKPCFYRHIELCSGACQGEISKEEYQTTIAELILFLRGKKKQVSTNIKQNMQAAVAVENFELAAKLRDQLILIAEVTSKQYELHPELTTQALQSKMSEDGVIYLQRILSEFLGLPKRLPLARIEGYDVSNTQGTNPAVSMVVFSDGSSDTSEYKVFNIRSLNTPNDFAMLQEALQRRQRHPEWGMPDLVVIDGGKGQVRSVLKVWQHPTIPVIGIAKDPDRLILPDFSREKLFFHELRLDSTNPALMLIQRIRDEAHRFSQKQHKKNRLRALLQNT